MDSIDIYTEIMMTIDQYVEKGKTVERIRMDLEDKYGYTIDYMDDIFLANMHTTITTYTKKKILLRTYRIWISNGSKPISEKKQVHGIKQFSRKFKDTFGASPQEAFESGMDLEALLPGGEIDAVLKSDSAFKRYKMGTKRIEIELDRKETEAKLKKCPIYIVDKDSWEMLNQKSLNRDVKVLMLIAVSKALEEQNSSVEITEDEFQLALSYDFEHPEDKNDYVIFLPTYTEIFRPVFDEAINKRLESIKKHIRGGTIDE